VLVGVGIIFGDKVVKKLELQGKIKLLLGGVR